VEDCSNYQTRRALGYQLYAVGFCPYEYSCCEGCDLRFEQTKGLKTGRFGESVGLAESFQKVSAWVPKDDVRRHV